MARPKGARDKKKRKSRELENRLTKVGLTLAIPITSGAYLGLAKENYAEKARIKENQNSIDIIKKQQIPRKEKREIINLINEKANSKVNKLKLKKLKRKRILIGAGMGATTSLLSLGLNSAYNRYRQQSK